MASSNLVRFQIFDKVQSRKPGISQSWGELVCQPQVQCVAVDRVPCYQRRNGWDPEKGLIDCVSCKRTEQINR